MGSALSTPTPMDIDQDEDDSPVIPPIPEDLWEYSEQQHAYASESRAAGHGAQCSWNDHQHRFDHERPKRILFYDRYAPYYAFTNFSSHHVEFEGRIYPTAEHLFQAHKFLKDHPDLAERIRRLKYPRQAQQEASHLRRFQRPDWFEVNVDIMDSVLEAKFTQHPSLVRLLVETGDSELIEDSPVDLFWGSGRDGTGRNELGKSLMRLRDKLTHSVSSADVYT